MYETFQEAASRETLEETGLNLPSYRFHELTFLNVINKEKEFHYVEVALAGILSSKEAAEVRNESPDEHIDVKWTKWSDFIDLIDNKHKDLYLSMHLFFQKHPEYRDIERFKALETLI